MADKETKSKSSQKAETTKAAKVETAKPAAKSSSAKSTAKPAAKPAAAKPAPKTEAKTVAAKPTEKTAAKPAAKSADVKAEKPETKPSVKKETATPESVVAKYSNRGRKSVVVEEEVPLKKAKKSENAHVAEVVEKHANSRGKTTSVVAEVKARKTEERYVAIQDAPSSDGMARLTNKQQNIILWVLIGVLIASLLAGIILGAVVGAAKTTVPYTYQYKSAQAVGYFGQQLGTVNRVRPVKDVRDGGLVASGMISAYPTYGYTLREVIGSDDAQVAARNALISESADLIADGTSANSGHTGGYSWMDKDGYLYSGTVANPVPTQRQLYKHTASIGMYGGDVSDDEPGIIKQVTMRPRGYSGYGVTGIYAPAGEVIKIEISKEDMDATGGIVIHIGQALYNGQANNIWTAKNQMQRMPVILNTMVINKNTAVLDEKTGVYTAYVGSFLGGPLYIRNTNATFTATISGGVKYSHFILGYTTPEEFEQNAKSSAPYFDLEVWSYGVLHSGPKSQANGLSYDDLYKAAVLWEKVALVTTTNSLQGIVFLYDPFVAAGAAVAFPGRRSVNCPSGWMRSSLNYQSLVTSGAWGNFHEYHHNFQGYGVGNGGEVTNNGMTLVSYSLFTKISSSRSLGNYGAAGLGGWNRYTSATWALDQLTEARFENGRQGLALYATLLHNFGPDNYIQAKVQQQRSGYGQSYTGYLRAWQDVTGYDMSYYFNSLLGAGLDNTYKLADAPMFVPVSSVYQTGRGIIANGRTEYIETMQPYVINYGKDFTIDLRKYDAPNGQYAQGSIVLPDGFKFTVKNVSQPEYGKIKDNGDGTYTYSPDKNHLRSGKIVVTLGITKDDNAFDVEDVDLVLGFEQTHEQNKWVLERTTYTYSADKMYTDAVEAYENGYVGYSGDAVTIDHTNPVQNCNTDIWFYPDTEQNRNDHPDAPDWHFLKDNTVAELKGKLYAEEEGRYRIYLRGRSNCALYYSVDGGKTYQLGARITNGSGANFYLNDENTYFDLDLKEKSWVYIKEVLIVNASAGSFIGVGMKQWTKPMFTMQEKYYDANGKEVAADSPDKVSTVTKYYNYLGIEVSEEEANRAELMAPTSAAYVNAYRTDYEAIQNEFTTEYFYTRDYNYNYKDNVLHSGAEKVISTNYDAGKSWNINSYPVENLFDGNRSTYIHSKNGWGMQADRPLQFVVDLGEVKSVNRMVYYSRTDYSTVNHLKLEASIDGNEYTLVGEFTDIERVGAACTVDFEETQMRYYRLTFIEGGSSLAIISEIEMWRVFEVNGAKMWSVADDRVDYFGKWTTEQVFSDFGYVMKGSRGSNIKFEFEGTRLGILSSDKFGTRFDVYVDGHKLSSVPQVKPLAEQKGEYGLSFLSDVLKEGKHTVVIKCTGEASFDSFVVYP